MRGMKLYNYVGPRRLAELVGAGPRGAAIHSPADVLAWAKATGQPLLDGSVTATYVVDAEGVLRVADRRSEHVACAGGGPVRCAGEMTFHLGSPVEVVEVSNQSTGFCPEPESWPAVAEALARAGLEGPGGFSPKCVFRRCLVCEGINLVKCGVFECGVCGQELPAEYNAQGVS